MQGSFNRGGSESARKCAAVLYYLALWAMPLIPCCWLALLPRRVIAETGVQFVSIGALTHSVPAMDISLNIQTE